MDICTSKIVYLCPMSKKVLLIIMDGWAHSHHTESNAIYHAETPFVDSLYENYPNTELITHSGNVGLPEGQMGNSEVGHMNIGAGRVVYQQIVRINQAIQGGSIKKKEALQEAIEYAKENDKPVHLMGLVSDGGVHSHIDHLTGLCDIMEDSEIPEYYIHAFTDGRDTDPYSGVDHIEEVQKHLKNSNGKLASLVGRYYAMDRDERWKRTKKAYDLLTKGKGEKVEDIIKGMEASYESEVSDEFIKPIVKVDDDGKPVATIEEDDVVICFNFRTDRCRQITEALTQKGFSKQKMKPLSLHFVTMTEYDKNFEGINVIMDQPDLKDTLGEILADADKKQIRIAETEKYPHVTYFFSGRREEEFKGEERIMIDSPKVATYDQKPEMSAFEVRDAIIKALKKKKKPDFVCLNFANPDMVGHTGDFKATVKAVETVDQCTKAVVEEALDNGYTCLVTSDHGNADFMINDDETPNTAHTKNPVPLFLIDKEDEYDLHYGKLGDLAPTILTLMEMDIPERMTGRVLI